MAPVAFHVEAFVVYFCRAPWQALGVIFSGTPRECGCSMRLRVNISEREDTWARSTISCDHQSAAASDVATASRRWDRCRWSNWCWCWYWLLLTIQKSAAYSIVLVIIRYRYTAIAVCPLRIQHVHDWSSAITDAWKSHGTLSKAAKCV